MKDYYYILGIKRTTNADDIKSAYRKLSKKFHPDLNNGDKFFEERFKEIQEAYDTLNNINKRKLYDELFEKHTIVNEDDYVENEFKPNANKNIGKAKFFIKDVWENGRLFSILFIIVFIFWNIVFLNMHTSKNELNLVDFFLTPVISAILAMIVAGILAKINNSTIDFFNMD